MDEEGRLRRLKVASADPDQAALCAVLEQMPPDRDLPHLMRSVIESKRPIVVEQVTSEYIESLGQGPEHLQALLAAGVTSFVAVPLLMRGQSLGALFLGSSTPSRVFGQGDLRLAEALADRAAMAIENARLYRASVHATQLRDQVLGVVAHDLRNPLSTILMQTSALKRQGPEPERRSQKPMEVIHRAATRMNRLIQDLLDVALMEAGQLTIERARLSAGGLIAEAVDMQRPLASSSSLELRVEVDPDVAEVWGDRDRLLQVFENLIGNAIKFTQAGGRITVGATSRMTRSSSGLRIRGVASRPRTCPVSLTDFGKPPRTGRQGAGLGLPITKGIVEAHGGRIWVESTAGSGSTFFFTIPRVSAAEERLSDPPPLVSCTPKHHAPALCFDPTPLAGGAQGLGWPQPFAFVFGLGAGSSVFGVVRRRDAHLAGGGPVRGCVAARGGVHAPVPVHGSDAGGCNHPRRASRCHKRAAPGWIVRTAPSPSPPTPPTEPRLRSG